MNKLTAALTALRYGASLTDPALWKKHQLFVNALVGLFGALVYFMPKGVELTDEDIRSIAGGIGTFVSVFNLYLTAATSDKIGLPARDSTVDRPRDGADSDADY